MTLNSLLMRLLLVILSLIFVITLTNGQSWENSRKWLFSQTKFFPTPGEDYIEFLRINDSVVQGREVMVLQASRINVNNGIVKKEPTSLYYVEVKNGQVVIFTSFDSLPRLTYDFSLQKGDTLQSVCWFGNEPMAYRIDSISQISIGPHQHQVQHVSPVTRGNCDYSHQLIDGIGDLRYLLPTPGTVDPPPGGYLVCYETVDGHVYGGWGGSCPDFTIAVKEPVPLLLFVPNPTQGTIQLGELLPATLEVFDLQGRKCSTLYPTTRVVSLGIQQPGQYVLLAHYADGHLERAQVLIAP